MKLNSKRKGSSYERDVARILSKWVTGTYDEIIYWRDSGSGSVSTIAKKNGKSASGLDGDFLCVDTSEKSIEYKQLLDIFFVDAKCLGNVHLNMINEKNQKSNQLLQNIIKVFKDAKSSKKIPMLIVKATNDKNLADFIVVPQKTGLQCKNCITYQVQEYKFIIVLQEEFFSMNNWKEFIFHNSSKTK